MSHRERLISALDGFVSLLLVYAVTRAVLGPADASILVLSIGSSAVLLFAVPHGPLSHEDFVFALAELDSFIDVSEEDALRIYALATGRHREAAAREADNRLRPPLDSLLHRPAFPAVHPPVPLKRFSISGAGI